MKLSLSLVEEDEVKGVVTGPRSKGVAFRDHRCPFSEELGTLSPWFLGPVARAGVRTHDEVSWPPPPMKCACTLFEIHSLLPLESGRRLA